jgi:hypothetical protein
LLALDHTAFWVQRRLRDKEARARRTPVHRWFEPALRGQRQPSIKAGKEVRKMKTLKNQIVEDANTRTRREEEATARSRAGC